MSWEILQTVYKTLRRPTFFRAKDINKGQQTTHGTKSTWIKTIESLIYENVNDAVYKYHSDYRVSFNNSQHIYFWVTVLLN